MLFKYVHLPTCLQEVVLNHRDKFIIFRAGARNDSALGRVWGFYSGVAKGSNILGCDSVSSLELRKIRRYFLRNVGKYSSNGTASHNNPNLTSV